MVHEILVLNIYIATRWHCRQGLHLWSLSLSFQFVSFSVLSLHFLLLVLSYVTFSSTQLLNRREAFRCEGQSEVWIGTLWRIISRDTSQSERRNEHTYTQRLDLCDLAVV